MLNYLKLAEDELVRFIYFEYHIIHLCITLCFGFLALIFIIMNIIWRKHVRDNKKTIL